MFAGAFASPNPRSVVLAGGGFFRSGPEGLYMAHFGWANPETFLAESQPNGGLLGFVQPLAGYRRLSLNGPLIRPGYGVTLFSGGDFYARFMAGAKAGEPVYAATLDGAPVSGEAVDAELTPWYVVNACAPGELAIISTWSKPQ